MRGDKNTATELRKEGLSYAALHAKLKISKSTLSNWFSNESWSKEIRSRLERETRPQHTVRIRELDRIRGLNLVRVYDEARLEARAEFELLKYDPIFISGIMLYWGEGDKRNNSRVGLTNTDPEMMRLFVCFLMRTCGIPTERISAHVLIYPDHDSTTCIEFWSTHIRIALSKFIKCTVIKGRHKTNRLPHGICMVYVSSTYLKAKVNEWLKILPEELMLKWNHESI